MLLFQSKSSCSMLNLVSLKFILLAFLVCSSTWAFAAVINFEAGSQTSSGSYLPTDNQSLEGVTFLSGGAQIRFSFSNSTIVSTLEDANTGESANNRVEGGSGSGDPLGFATRFNGQTIADQNALGYNGSTFLQGDSGPGLGDYFLRGNNILSDFGVLRVDYVNGTSSTAVAFQIWDLDGNETLGSEQYLARFFNSNGDEIGAVATPSFDQSGAFNSLDGRPYLMTFDSAINAEAGFANQSIVRFEVDFIGTKADGIGVAFDNFNPTGIVIPEPSSVLLFGFAASALAFSRKRIG